MTLSINKKSKWGIFSGGALAGIIGTVALTVILTACGDSPGYRYTVGATVSGLAGTGLVLQNNAGDDLSVTANGTVTFRTPLDAGAGYNVTIKTQPTALNQICAVVSGSGVINGARATVAVNCLTPPPRFAIEPSVKYAYAANYGSNNISTYTINSATGALTAGTAMPAGTNPAAIMITPSTVSGKFVYAANYNSNNISTYTIDPATGALSAGTTVATGNKPASLTIDPSGEFAYAVNFSDNTISVYAIDPVTGALSAGTAVSAGTNPYTITIDPDGRFAYATNAGSNNISVYTIDQTTGALTAQPAVLAGTNPSPVKIDSTGKFAYVANTGSNTISAYTIDQVTGALNVNGSTVGTGTNPGPVTLVSNATAKFAYVANFMSGNISAYVIDQNSGVLTSGTMVGAGTNPYAIAVDPTCQFAYAANYTSNNISVFKINQSTAELNIVATTPLPVGSKNPYAINIASTGSGTFAYVANAGSNNISVFKIDPITGALTLQQ